MFKRLKQIKKDESGASSILVVICLVVMLGFTAMAVDVGNAYNRKVDMQDACDLSALAAADSLPDSDATEQLAKQYAQKNGYDEEDVTVSILDGGEKVEVKIAQDVKTYFASVVGYKTLAVSCKAVAAAGARGAKDYAIFSGNKMFFGLHGNINIPAGDIHSNGAANISGTMNIADGVIEVPKFDYQGSLGNYETYVDEKNIIDMPDYTEIISKKLYTVSDDGYIAVDNILSSDYANSHISGGVLTIKSGEKIYIPGDLTVDSGKVNNIVVQGTLKIGGFFTANVPITVEGNLLIDSGANFNNTTNIKGNLTAQGQIGFKQKIDISGTVVGSQGVNFAGTSDLTLNRAVVVSDGNQIAFSGGKVQDSGNGYSVFWGRGNTHINVNNYGSNTVNVNALFYAPYGEVIMDGKGINVKGSIVGNQVGTNDGDLTVELPKNDPNWEFGGQSKDKKRSSSAKLVG